MPPACPSTSVAPSPAPCSPPCWRPVVASCRRRRSSTRFWGERPPGRQWAPCRPMSPGSAGHWRAAGRAIPRGAALRATRLPPRRRARRGRLPPLRPPGGRGGPALAEHRVEEARAALVAAEALWRGEVEGSHRHRDLGCQPVLQVQHPASAAESAGISSSSIASARTSNTSPPYEGGDTAPAANSLLHSGFLRGRVLLRRTSCGGDGAGGASVRTGNRRAAG